MNGIHLYWIMNTQREPDWAIDPNEKFQFDPNFDEFSDYVNRSLSMLDILDDTPQISPTHNLLVNKHAFHQTPIDYDKFRPYVGWVNSDIVKQTIDQTTQWGVALDSFQMKRHLKSRNPALNVPRRHESVATDTCSGQWCQTSTSLSGERLIGSRCIPYEIQKTVCEHTGGQHQKSGSYGQIVQ